MDIKAALEEMDDRVDINVLVKSICKIINVDMDIPVKDAEIFQILKRIPKNCDGCYSFPHFLYAMGSPELAKNKRVFMLSMHSVVFRGISLTVLLRTMFIWSGPRRFDDMTESKFKMEGRNAKCYCWDAQDDKQCGGDRKDCNNFSDEEEEGDGCLKPTSDETEAGKIEEVPIVIIFWPHWLHLNLF